MDKLTFFLLLIPCVKEIIVVVMYSRHIIAGISKKSRSLFLELDATAVKTHHQQQQQPSVSPLKSPLPSDDARRRSREV